MMPLHFSVTIYREMVSFFKFKFNALFYSSQALYLTEKYVTLAAISCTRILDTGQLSLLLLYAETIFFFLLSNFSTKIRSEYVQNDNVEKDISRALRQPIKYQMTRTIICESGVTTSSHREKVSYFRID